MLNKLKAFFQTEIQENKTDGIAKRNLACAALLVETAMVDQNFDESETEALFTALKTQFNLNEDACVQLKELAHEESQKATSTHQFTQLIVNRT